MSRDRIRRHPQSFGRRLLFRLSAVLLAFVVIAVILEIGTRLLVPSTTFQVLCNVYQPDPDPRIGYTLKRGYSGSAFGVDLVTNSLGFRGREWSPVKPEGVFRIALIGDSHAFGFGVAFEQTMGELLAKRLQARIGRPVEVMNFAVNGYNAKQELAVLEHKALSLSPDLVLVVPCNNDNDPPWWVDAGGFMRWGIKNAVAGTDNIVGWDRHQQAFARFQQKAFARSRFLLWLRIQMLRYKMAQAAKEVDVAQGITSDAHWRQPATVGPVDAALVEPVCVPLVAMIDLCRERGIGFGILLYSGLMNWRTTFLAVATEKDVPLLELIYLLDGADSWKELVRKWSLGWDSHMAAPAHAVWAAGVEDFLVENGLVR